MSEKPPSKAPRSSPFLFAAVPAGIGLLIMLLIQGTLHPLPVLTFKIDLGSLALLAGMLGSLALLNALLGKEREIKAQMVERAQQKAGHRRFLRRLDHELKNPLTALRAALVNLGNVEEEPSNPPLRDATLQAARLSRLVSDLRKLAELEEIELEKTPVDIPDLLTELIEALHDLPEQRAQHINLVVSRVPWSPPALPADADLLGIAFYNLLENALKYSSPTDQIEVRVLEDAHHLIVEVADSGAGIAAQDLPYLFEELYRGANAHGQSGSGLGLALAQRVIQRHNGTISVRTRQQDQKGTVFTVRLPLPKE